MSVPLNKQEIHNIVKKFRYTPNEHDYFLIKNWWHHNQHYNYGQQQQDPELMICVRLFLLGANIKHVYEKHTKEQHTDWIIEIRDLIDSSDMFVRGPRKAFLDCGSGS